jgi:hypothetical protein
MNWFKKYLIAFASDTWTYVGLLIAFFTLDGSAKVVTGYLILGGLAIWLISLPWREDS